MTQDINPDVPVEEQPSTEEVVSPKETTEEKKTVETKEAPSEEKVREMIAEATVKAVKEAKELGRRELQSQQNKNQAEQKRLARRAEVAEGTLITARQGLDPETAATLELAELRAREKGRTTLDQEEEQVKQQAEFHQGFIDKQTQFITDLGIDPKDERIDWASDAPNYLDAMERIQRSIVTIQKETVQSFEKRLKGLEVKATETTTEANSVNTATPVGVVEGSDAEFKSKFGAGELPMTKANIDRYNKIKAQY